MTCEALIVVSVLAVIVVAIIGAVWIENRNRDRDHEARLAEIRAGMFRRRGDRANNYLGGE